MINVFPCFRYFALNRHQALQTGRIYVHQNSNDGHFTIDELRDMVEHDRDTLVLHFGASLRGTRQFWSETEVI